MVALQQQVIDALPNAVEVYPTLPEELKQEGADATERGGLEPHELFARFYRARRGTDAPDELLRLFNQLLEEAERASA